MAYEMTKEQLKELLEVSFLTQSDAAWLTGAALRTVRSWCIGEYPVPQSAALLLEAYRDDMLKVEWFMKRLGKPPGVA